MNHNGMNISQTNECRKIRSSIISPKSSLICCLLVQNLNRNEANRAYFQDDCKLWLFYVCDRQIVYPLRGLFNDAVPISGNFSHHHRI